MRIIDPGSGQVISQFKHHLGPVTDLYAVSFNCDFESGEKSKKKMAYVCLVAAKIACKDSLQKIGIMAFYDVSEVLIC